MNIQEDATTNSYPPLLAMFDVEPSSCVIHAARTAERPYFTVIAEAFAHLWDLGIMEAHGYAPSLIMVPKRTRERLDAEARHVPHFLSVAATGPLEPETPAHVVKVANPVNGDWVAVCDWPGGDARYDNGIYYDREMMLFITTHFGPYREAGPPHYGYLVIA